MSSKNIGLTHVGMYIKKMDGTWIPFSGTITLSPAEQTQFEQLRNADDLTTVVLYNEATTRGTVKNITYSSPALGLSATETFTSGVNSITIVRTGL